ncbi:hypothetical protein FKM82_026153 [Ascaphus truei]
MSKMSALSLQIGLELKGGSLGARGGKEKHREMSLYVKCGLVSMFPQVPPFVCSPPLVSPGGRIRWSKKRRSEEKLWHARPVRIRQIKRRKSTNE